MRLWKLTEYVETMMADIAQIQADVAALQDAGAVAAQELQQLTDMVQTLQAGAVTQEQLDNLHESLQGVTTKLVDAANAADAGAGPPVVNPEDPFPGAGTTASGTDSDPEGEDPSTAPAA
jgi:hypothetical protein